MKTVATVVIATLCCMTIALCQTETATISGRVTDPSGAALSGADVQVQNVLTGREVATKTNSSGLYVAAALQPGTYRVIVSNPGFKQIVKPDVVLNVQDNASLNFSMTIGSASEIVTVEGGAPLVNTQDAAVSTVVDRHFADNIPMNGRSFQTLIQLTPGVVLTTNTYGEQGQFSVNGQRADANYWAVDGVSANIGVSNSLYLSNGLGGALGSFSVLGGTNGLVSVDALQEFRIQTSTYAPEFGRSPGGQISIVTRSGTNEFHGTAFDYFRNDILDANDWFNGYKNNPPLPKAEERQNDFGGTLSGPIVRNKTFFFFSYEGLRLRLPQTALATVPDQTARQSATPAMQPYLNAFPIDPHQPDLGNGVAQFNYSYSNPATLNAYSLRIDHKMSNKWTLFGRYNYSPSGLDQRFLNTVSVSNITTQTATAGATWLASPLVTNDLRFNYSRTSAVNEYHMDNFGGAIPLTVSPFPSPYTTSNSVFLFVVESLASGAYEEGSSQRNLQRQFNVIDSLSVQKGSHGLKFGIDFRRLSPVDDHALYTQQAYFRDVPSAELGNLDFSLPISSLPVKFWMYNLGIFAQDTWRVSPRLTATFGLRSEVDFAPSSTPGFAAVTGYNVRNLSQLALAPAGTPSFKTTYGNVAPRFGVAYQVSQNQNWQTVLRGGFGVFFDLISSETGNLSFYYQYPFGAVAVNPGGTFPLSGSAAAPPPITALGSTIGAFDPNVKLPYTLEWNVAVEQALGRQQSISASYVGAAGRRLLQTAQVNAPSPSIGTADLVSNSATSDYDALQLHFQRRLTHGLQAVASYSWSHSIDEGSGASFGNYANLLVPQLGARANRGPSDFDIRHASTAGVIYDLPSPQSSIFAKAIFAGWSADNFVTVRSAPPVNVYNSVYSYGSLYGTFTQVRPDVVAGQPFYLYGSQFPGAKVLNPAAFTSPPTDSNGNPLRQGYLGRNALRAFGAWQWDFAVHHDFPIRETVKLQFRAEMFNVLNHPNFGPPVGDQNAPNFGVSTQMLGQSLAGGNIGGGAFDPLYQIGGPRSIQLALKLSF